MIKKEKGIFTKLLAVAGAVLVISGVFVFQGGSRAEDETTPADSNGIGLGTGLTGTEPEPAGNEEPATNPTPAPEPIYKKAIEYYTVTETLDEETGDVVKTESLVFSDPINSDNPTETFVITDTIPQGEGEFLDWRDEVAEKHYVAGEEVTLTENQKLKLVAEFKVMRSYALGYNVDGGSGKPNSQACESSIGYCDFTISMIEPTREGYEFRGWQKIDDNSMTYAPGASIRSRSYLKPLILKAVWAEIKTYSLIYEGNGGNGVPAAQECKSADGTCRFKLSDAMPTRSSFEFMNWQKGTEVLMPGTEIVVTETTTILVANWNPITVFTLEYVAEEAKDVPEAQKCETFMGTCTFVITDKVPTKDGFVFKGWRLEGKDDMLAQAGDQLEVGVDGPLNLRILAVWSKLYPILNSGEVFGVGERIMIRTAAENTKFKELIINEASVPEDYFKVSEGGGTSVIITNAFSQALTAGEHSVKIVWEDGEANGIISVNQNEDGTKRFMIVDASGSVDGDGLMLRPKAGAVSKESVSGTFTDTAKDNTESNFDAVRTLIIVAVVVFVAIYLVNRFYIRRKMEFIENFD